MAHRFLSPKWLEEGMRKVDADPKFKKVLGDSSASVLTIIRDPPAGVPRFVWHHFEGGKLAQVEGGNDDKIAQRPSDFTLAGTYDAFAQLQKGTLTVAGAYLKGLVKVSGDLTKAVSFAPAFMRFNELVRAVPTEY